MTYGVTFQGWHKHVNTFYLVFWDFESLTGRLTYLKCSVKVYLQLVDKEKQLNCKNFQLLGNAWSKFIKLEFLQED